MKRKISFLLSLCMLVSIFASVQAFAAEGLQNDGYVQVFGDDFSDYTPGTVESKTAGDFGPWYMKRDNTSYSIAADPTKSDMGNVIAASTENTSNVEAAIDVGESTNVKISFDLYLAAHRYTKVYLLDKDGNQKTDKFDYAPFVANLENNVYAGEDLDVTTGFYGQWNTVTMYLDLSAREAAVYVNGNFAGKTTHIPSTISAIWFNIGNAAVATYIDNVYVSVLDTTDYMTQLGSSTTTNETVYSDNFDDENDTVGTDVGSTGRTIPWNATGRATIAEAPADAPSTVSGNVAELATGKNMETKNWIMAGSDGYTAAELANVKLSMDIKVTLDSSKSPSIQIYKGTSKTSGAYDSSTILGFNKDGKLKYYQGTSVKNLDSSFAYTDKWLHVEFDFAFDVVNNSGTYSVTVSDGTDEYTTSAGTLVAGLQPDTSPIGLYSVVINNTSTSNIVYVDNVTVTYDKTAVTPAEDRILVVREGNGTVKANWSGAEAGKTIILALYDKQGVLKSCDIVNSSSMSAASATVTVAAQGDYVMAYYWEDLSTLKPISLPVN